MSGFIAIFNTDGAPVDRELLEKLTSSLQFKGPDGQKTWTDGPIGLGHTLFRTTHESRHENQPASLDGKVWITGYIRIDGRKELVNELGIKDGIKLNQTPDSELVLHAYRKWGEKCPAHLLGDFAFVLWDADKQRLFCAIDQFGMRQLYYSRAGNTIIVSNSIHCLRLHPAISTKLNEQALGDFLLFGDHMWMDQSQTSFADIQGLLPAHLLLVDDKGLRTQRYWNLPDDIPLLKYRKEHEYLEHFDEVFKVAIADRLRAPQVVISLSGGLDSSAIAATIKDMETSGQQVLDLSAVTVLYDSIHHSDEKYYAQLVAKHLKFPVQYIDGGNYPFMSPPIPTSRPLEIFQPALWLDLNRTAATMGRVMLSGSSGDNLLVFSSILKSLKGINPLTLLPAISRLKTLYGVYPGFGSGLMTKFNHLRGKDTHSKLPYPDWLNSEFESMLNLKDRWSEWHTRQSPHPNLRYSVLYESLLRPSWSTDDDYLHTSFTQPDKRDPFLDLRLVEFVASLPALPWLFKKHLLRSSMAERLPAEIITRRKTPLGNIHSTLIKQNGTKWTDDWQAHPKLGHFVNRQKIPAFNEQLNGVNKSYMSLRPYLLNSWIAAI